MHARHCTTVVKEHIIPYNGRDYYICDAGGQRSQQRKWIHMFNDVTAVIFVVALNEYDEMLPEDPSMNSLKESLNVWKKIISAPWFINTPMILLFNKVVRFPFIPIL